MPRWPHSRRVWLCALIVAAFTLRVTALDTQSLWRDEVDALRFATASWTELINTFRLPGQNGPLFFAVLRGWIALTGQTAFALRYFSLLAGVLTIPLMYILAQRLANEAFPVKWLSAGCAVVSPYFVWYSQEAKMYALLVALAVLAIYALRRATQGHSRWWAVMVIVTSLSVYMHILAALLIPVEFVMLLLWWPRSWRTWLYAALAFACLTLPYLPLLAWQYKYVLEPAKTGYPAFTLGEMVYTLVYGFAAGIVGQTPGWVIILPLTILVVLGLIFGPTQWQHRGILVVWITLPILALYIVSLQRPIFTDRYLIWIGPAVYVLVALGLWVLWQQSRLVAMLVTLPLAAVFGLGIYSQATQPIKSDLRAAAHFVEQRAAADDLLAFQIPYIRYTFDYYYPRPFEWIDCPYTNYGMSDTEVDAKMRELIGERRVVWLVASEMAMWDQKLQVYDWFNTHTRRTAEAHFTLVDIYRFEMP